MLNQHIIQGFPIMGVNVSLDKWRDKYFQLGLFQILTT